MSVMAAIIPYKNGDFQDGNVLGSWPWRLNADGEIEIQFGRTDPAYPSRHSGWDNTEDAWWRTTFQHKHFLFIEVEDATDDDLVSYYGKRRGKFNWRPHFTPDERSSLLDKNQYFKPRRGKGIKKTHVEKGPDHGKPRIKRDVII